MKALDDLKCQWDEWYASVDVEQQGENLAARQRS
jgi:hypothetical protein